MRAALPRGEEMPRLQSVLPAARPGWPLPSLRRTRGDHGAAGRGEVMTTTTTRDHSCWPFGLTWSRRPPATLGPRLPNLYVFHPSSPDPSSHSHDHELSPARHDLVGRQRSIFVAASVQFCCPPLFSFPCPRTLDRGPPAAPPYPRHSFRGPRWSLVPGNRVVPSYWLGWSLLRGKRQPTRHRIDSAD